MSSTEHDTITHMLQALELLLDTANRTSVLAEQLVEAQRTGAPLSPSTLRHYDEQLSELNRRREQMRGVISRWWTLLAEGH